jgi:hypothetical protein
MFFALVRSMLACIALVPNPSQGLFQGRPNGVDPHLAFFSLSVVLTCLGV